MNPLIKQSASSYIDLPTDPGGGTFKPYKMPKAKNISEFMTRPYLTGGGQIIQAPISTDIYAKSQMPWTETYPNITKDTFMNIKRGPNVQVKPTISNAVGGGFPWDKANPNLKPRPLNKPPLVLDNRVALGKNRSVIGNKPTGIFDWDYKGKVSDPSKLPPQTTPLKPTAPGVNNRGTQGVMTNTTGRPTYNQYNGTLKAPMGIGDFNPSSPLMTTAKTMGKVLGGASAALTAGQVGDFALNNLGVQNTYTQNANEGYLPKNTGFGRVSKYLDNKSQGWRKDYSQGRPDKAIPKLLSKGLGYVGKAPEAIEKTIGNIGVGIGKELGEIYKSPSSYASNTLSNIKNQFKYPVNEIKKTFGIKPTISASSNIVDNALSNTTENKVKSSLNTTSPSDFSKLIPKSNKNDMLKELKTPKQSTTIPKVKSFSSYLNQPQSFNN